MPIPYTPFQFTDGGQPSIARGQFVYYQASLKDLIQSFIDGDPNTPFENVIIGGSRSYQNSNNTLKLESVFQGTSGYVSIKMKTGFQSLFRILTENNDYFEDNALSSIKSDWSDTADVLERLEENGWPSMWIQDDAEFSDSRAIFGLDEGDYVSIDVDGETSKVAQMRIRLSGVDFINGKELSNETFLSKLWVRKWDPNLPNPNFTPEPSPDPDTDPDPFIPEPDRECPDGYFFDQTVGACVPIETDPNPEPDPDPDPEDDISTGAVVLVAVGVGLIIFLAVRS